MLVTSSSCVSKRCRCYISEEIQLYCGVRFQNHKKSTRYTLLGQFILTTAGLVGVPDNLDVIQCSFPELAYPDCCRWAPIVCYK